MRADDKRRDACPGRPGRAGLLVAAGILAALVLITACSRDDVPEHAIMFPDESLPDVVLGYVQWDDIDERKLIRRTHCQMEDEFYVMVGEGRDFVLRVGFWGQDARAIDDIDFEQADSVELRTIDDELYFYRYTILRILPGMGPVSGSVDSARGQTWLRPTSTEAVVKHRSGVELEFELSCPQPEPVQVAGY